MIDENSVSLKIDDLINKYVGEVIDIRRSIHKNPELSLKEVKTSQLVFEELNKLNLDIKRNVGVTGVVANLNPNTKGKTLMLRADMDALPINETANFEYKSEIENVMHACGHDVHTAILLGAAKILNELKDEIDGNIKFVFQPAEENNPVGGAPLMIKEGVLENPTVDAALGLHVFDTDLGTITTKRGVITSKSDRIFITIKGKSSHGSAPHMGNDAMICAGYLITSLQTLVSRNISSADNAVVTLSTIHGGTRYNVIPDEIKIEGTVRCASPHLVDFIPKRIEEIIKGICQTYNCDYDFEYRNGYPSTINDTVLTEFVLSSLSSTFGKDKITELDNALGGGEDFSFFAERVPSNFMFIGCKSEINKDNCILHNPDFICDEDCIAIGMKALVTLALNYFNR